MTSLIVWLSSHITSCTYSAISGGREKVIAWGLFRISGSCQLEPPQLPKCANQFLLATL